MGVILDSVMQALATEDSHLSPVNGDPIRINNATSSSTVCRVAPPEPAVDCIVLTVGASTRIRHVSHQIRIVLRSTSGVSTLAVFRSGCNYGAPALGRANLQISGVGECRAKLAPHHREDLTVAIVTIALLVQVTISEAQHLVKPIGRRVLRLCLQGGTTCSSSRPHQCEHGAMGKQTHRADAPQTQWDRKRAQRQ